MTTSPSRRAALIASAAGIGATGAVERGPAKGGTLGELGSEFFAAYDPSWR